MRDLVVSVKCATEEKDHHLTNLKQAACVFSAPVRPWYDGSISPFSPFSSETEEKELAMEYLSQSLANAFLFQWPVTHALTEDSAGVWAGVQDQHWT